MKKLFNLLLPVIFSVSIFATVTYTACKQDKCKGMTCHNGGSCNDGKCICPDGYSGPLCETVDPCKDVVCLNNGKCKNGDCECPFEYEGDSCQNEIRDNYAKTYEGYGVHGSNPPINGWRLRVTKKGENPKLMQVELLNLAGVVGQKYEIVLTDKNAFDIPRQNIGNSLAEGNGVISPTKIEVSLRLTRLPDSAKTYDEYYNMTAP